MNKTPARTVWLFCRVIDNFGDAGVSWRLAKNLHGDLGWQVVLWIDHLAALAALAPQTRADAAVQTVDGIQIRRWDNAADTAPGLSGSLKTPPDLIVEMFACTLPESVRTLICRHNILWLNWEYLSAEDWAENAHLLPSPQKNGVQKYFYFMGFSEKSGGLLREKYWTEKNFRQPENSHGTDTAAADGQADLIFRQPENGHSTDTATTDGQADLIFRQPENNHDTDTAAANGQADLIFRQPENVHGTDTTTADGQADLIFRQPENGHSTDTATTDGKADLIFRQPENGHGTDTATADGQADLIFRLPESTAAADGALRIFAFGYASPVWQKWWRCWQQTAAKLHKHGQISLAGGQIVESLQHLPCGGTAHGLPLRTCRLPFVAQEDFDALLAENHILIVRGEDSFVRAQYAARPFFWQIYPQADNAHIAKLHAFWQRVYRLFPPALAQAHRALSDELNGADILDGNIRAAHWQLLAENLPLWQNSAQQWRDFLFSQPSAAEKLAQWVQLRLK